MKVAASARADAAFISISRTRSSVLVNRPSANATAISSISTKRSPEKMPTMRPMRIYPAVHYTMGGLWVDYNLMSNVPGLHVIGEANFSDHGANRLGASALMQGSGGWLFRAALHAAELSRRSDGQAPWRRIILNSTRRRTRSGRAPERMLEVNGKRSVDSFHRELGLLLWDKCGMARNAAGLREASRASPNCARNFGRTCASRATARVQSVTRARRTRRRFSRVRRADVRRRARPRRIVRRPFS